MGNRRTRTSRAAYAAIDPAAGRLRALAYRLIHEAGERGMTALEVVDASGHDRWGIQPRISELVSARAVVDSGHTRTNPSGRQAIVWVLPEYGLGRDAVPFGVAAEHVMQSLAAKMEGRDNE
ncbi:hypothetical protein [Novosphingobium sp. SG707]|uniref:hypothetical protein n=1 Tax=Novosphingobium sp. SG707 TaxID=2586996 RepID=UPI00144886E3|nr:hypothetical protein [Novosphingobium sp. SG707]NKJ02872.1 hypothetical protein [Novosphingobium sp. SG707]